MNRWEFLRFASAPMLVMAALLVLPLVVTAGLSFTDASFGTGLHFTGLANYRNLWSDERLRAALSFTALFVLISLPLHTLLGLAIALMLPEVSARMRSTVLVSIAMPFILTPVVGTLVFSWLFKDYWGLIPWLLDQVGVQIQWFGAAWPARCVIILWGIWWAFGFNALVLYAGLQTLPDEPMRAALVDGASPLQRLRHIVLPHLAPYLALVTLFNLIDGLRVFDAIWVMTRGAPGMSTASLAYLNYYIAFYTRELGPGAAVSMVTVVVTLIAIGPLLWRQFRESARA